MVEQKMMYVASDGSTHPSEGAALVHEAHAELRKFVVRSIGSGSVNDVVTFLLSYPDMVREHLDKIDAAYKYKPEERHG